MKRLLITLAISLIGFCPVLVTAVPAFADSKTEICAGIGETGTDCSSNNGHVSHLLSSVIKILSFVVGIAAVIMIIIAGFKYITAGGDSNAVGSAKSTLIYAIVGLVVASLAQILVHFVLANTKT